MSNYWRGYRKGWIAGMLWGGFLFTIVTLLSVLFWADAHTLIFK